LREMGVLCMGLQCKKNKGQYGQSFFHVIG
jgi:hypothetical protein